MIFVFDFLEIYRGGNNAGIIEISLAQVECNSANWSEKILNSL